MQFSGNKMNHFAQSLLPHVSGYILKTKAADQELHNHHRQKNNPGTGGNLYQFPLPLALLAGAFWAAYVVLSQRTGAAFDKLDGLAIAMVVALAFILPFGVGSMGEWTATVWGKGAAIAVLSSVLPYSLELLALRSLSQQAFGILLSLEPAVAALAGLIVLGQRLETLQLAGMALVVGASALVLGGGARHTPLDGG